LRTRRSLLNFATVTLFTLVTTVIALFTQPSLEKWLGAEPFGAVRLLIDGYGYLALLELGLSGALAPLLVRAISQNDGRSLREVIAAGVQGYVRVSLAMIVVGLALVPLWLALAPLSGFGWMTFGLGPADLADFQRAWVVGLLSFLPLGLLPLRSLVEVEQRGYWVNLLLTAQAVLITGISLWLAWSGWGVTGQSIALVVGSWAFYAVVAGLVQRRPGLLHRIWSTPTSASLRHAIRSLSVPTLVITLSARISILSDNFIVAGKLGVSLVTALYFTQRLATLAQGVLQGIGSATWAALADLHARNEHETFNRRLVELTRLGTILAVAGLAPIVAFNSRFFELWNRDPTHLHYGGDRVILIAAFKALIFPAISLWVWCFTATGRVRQIVVPVVLTSAVSIGLSLVLTSYLAMLGPLLGTALANAGCGLWYFPWLLRREFGTSPRALARALADPSAAGSLYAIGLWKLARRFPPGNMASLLVEMSLAAVVFLVLAAVVVMLDPANRVLWRSRWDSLRVGFPWPKLAIFRAPS
jgi:O-antigen/teichoic acid export membrane protein